MIRPKVLVIDDELIVLESLADLLEFFEFNAIVTTNAETAMEILAGIKIDVIVLDFMMPEMNGIRFAQALLERELKIPVIIHSGAEIQESLNLPNVKQVIRKPASPWAIINAIHEALKETKQACASLKTKNKFIGKDS